MAIAPLTQEFRVARMTTPLAADRMSLVELSGAEYVNELGLFRARVICSQGPLSAAEMNQLIGFQVSIGFDMGDGAERQVNQSCFGLRSMGRTDAGAVYELELRPWIWVMSRSQTSRIFENETVNDIIAQVVLGYDGVEGAQFEDKSGATYPNLEYTVQYQETDLNFIRRLMEEFGINFHVEMREATQVLVLTDATDDFAQPIARRRSFQPATTPAATEEVFDTWIAQRHLTTGSVRMTDYNFLTPTQDMRASASRESAFSPAVLESYEHPGRYPTSGIGNSLALRRLDALRGADQQAKASGHAPSLGAGMRFTLDDDGDTGVAGEYAVIAATHHYFGGSFASGGSGELGYHGEFTLVPADLPIAPDRVTPRPYLRGPQSARVVVGADGDVDEHGRIKVEFPWDTSVQSMYCRVSQLWAGAEWGAQFIPREGMEVLVDFMEGDPDRPVIVGCLYNDSNRYPGSLPEKKTTSGIKTNSIGGEGFNALIFEDKAGQEEVFIHAQKDLMIQALDRELVAVGGDSTRTVDGKSETTVGGDMTTTVTGAILIESYDSIELKVGSSSIRIEPSQITISAAMITVEAQGQLQATGLMTTVSGGAGVTIEAPLVRIN